VIYVTGNHSRLDNAANRLTALLERKIQNNHERMMARMDTQLEKIEACRGKTEATNLEANREEIEFKAEYEAVPREQVAVQTSGALKKRHGDWHLAVRRRGQPNKRTQGDGESRKKMAAACEMTRRSIPAHRKGRRHKGPTVEQR
jgi:hypothetical protein